MTTTLIPRRGRPLHKSPVYDRFVLYLRAIIATEGRAPSYSRVCRHLGINYPADVRKMVRYGERRGDLVRVHGLLRVCEKATDTLHLPCQL